MFCPDCELETDKLNYRGICERCYKRMTNKKYRGQEYKPLASIKGTKEYNRAMGKILKTIEEKKGKKPKMKPIATKTSETVFSKKEDLKSIYYGKVSKDIKNAFAENNLSEDYLKSNNLENFVETFLSLMQEDNNSFIIQCKKAEKIFNDLGKLYNHQKESYSWDEIDKINEISYAEKALFELRRPTKETLDAYIAIDDIISYLQKDEQFMELLKEVRINLKQRLENQKNKIYLSEVTSNLTDIEQKVENKLKLYNCKVWCFNLYGNPQKTLFTANNGVKARNEIDAKIRFKAFLQDKFPNITYKEADIIIEEMELDGEQEKWKMW